MSQSCIAEHGAEQKHAAEPTGMVTGSAGPSTLIDMYYAGHAAEQKPLACSLQSGKFVLISALQARAVLQDLQQSRNMPLNPLAWSPAVQGLTVAGVMMVAALVWSSLRRPSLTNQRQNVTL